MTRACPGRVKAVSRACPCGVQDVFRACPGHVQGPKLHLVSGTKPRSKFMQILKVSRILKGSTEALMLFPERQRKVEKAILSNAELPNETASLRT